MAIPAAPVRQDTKKTLLTNEIPMIIPVPSAFNFWRTVYSHGWCALPPFEVDTDTGSCSLRMVANASPGNPVAVTVNQPERNILRIQICGSRALARREKQHLVAQVRTVLRLDEDFSEFYAEARKHPSFRWVPKFGAGRLLRAPTVFEDVVKMLCTTNCSWALTETMVRNLCRKLGARVQGRDAPVYAFPVPQDLAESSEKFLRREIRAGYRAPYLRELGRRVVTGDLDVEAWRQSPLPTEELYREVCSVKGIGPYAAGAIMKLLGRYDYLAVDSWCRKKFFEIHRNGRAVNDKAIEKFYEPFGKWRGLFFWMDVTKHWYEHEVPF